MKVNSFHYLSKGLTVVVIVIATALVVPEVSGQIYSVTTPITGSMSLGFRDLNGSNPNSGTCMLDFNTLSETIYLDHLGGTLRQVGTLSFTPTAESVVIQDFQLRQIPNQPVFPLWATILIKVAPVGNVISFDTGPAPLTWNAGSGTFSVDSFLVSIPMTGTYFLSYNGGFFDTTYTGSLDFTLNFWYGARANTYNTVSMAGYPTSLQLSGLGTSAALLFAPSSLLSEFTTPEGLHVRLNEGTSYFSPVGYGESFSWSSSDVAAFLVPEPSSIRFGILFTSLALLRRRRTNV